MTIDPTAGYEKSLCVEARGGEVTIRERVWHAFYCLWYDNQKAHPRLARVAGAVADWVIS